MRRTLKNLKIVLLCLLGAAVIVFTIFMIGITLSFDSMSERTYYEYCFDIPSSENQLIVKEWYSFRNSGIEFYLKSGHKETLLESVSTDEYFPFGNNDYMISWSEDGGKADITYGFSKTVRKQIALELGRAILK